MTLNVEREAGRNEGGMYRKQREIQGEIEGKM
jgi:hypothetical protein